MSDSTAASAGEGNNGPAPLPWRARAASILTMPGSWEDHLRSLRSLLLALDKAGGSLEEELPWPTVDSPTVARDAVQRMGKCGLIERVGRDEVRLSSAARRWLETDEPFDLIAVLHAHTRFFGEILFEISTHEKGLDHNELVEIGSQHYGMAWTSPDQVRRRANLLRSAKFVELRFDGKLVPLPAGNEALSRLIVTSRESLLEPSGRTASVGLQVSPPSVIVGHMLEGLSVGDLKSRKHVIGYIPRSRQGGIVDSLRTLVAVFTPQGSRDDLDALCRDAFGIKATSASAALGMLTGGGLVEQVGPSSYAATRAALSWLESGDNLELVRILHAHVACIGELLDALEHAERAPALAPYMAQAYGMPRQDTAGIRTRLRLLLACDLIEETGWARYRATGLGVALRDSLPRLEPRTENLVRDDRAYEESAGQTAESRVEELVTAAQDSDHPERLEKATRDAFDYLGFTAEHVGGSGRTDVLVRFTLEPGVERCVIVDTKSAATGVVSERQINFDTLNEHKEQHEADSVAVVGPSFVEGRLRGWAKQRGVALIEAAFLGEVVSRQDMAALSVRDLAKLFAGDGAGPSNITQAWSRADQRNSLVSHVVAALSREARDFDEVTQGALSHDQLWVFLRTEMDAKPQPDDIKHVLSMLASPLLEAVRSNGGRHVAIEHPATIARRLRALARAAQHAANMLEL